MSTDHSGRSYSPEHTLALRPTSADATTEPNVSVVIPTYNRRPYLENVIKTFLAQDAVKEIVFVIDGSTDGTVEYLEEMSVADDRIRYVVNAMNRGLAYSRNKGMEFVTCEYAFVAEDDLTLSDGFMSTLLEHMRDTGADVISARNIFRHEHESMEESIVRTDAITGPTINRRRVTVQVSMNVPDDQTQPLLPSVMLGRTETFRKVGWDENYRGNAWREESDFQLEAVKSGFKLVYCPHTISFNLVISNDKSGVHSLSRFRRVKSIIRNNWYFVRKHRELIAREFGITNLYVYIVRFSAWKISRELVLPFAFGVARKILAPFLGR